jgi:hypothetical protein
VIAPNNRFGPLQVFLPIIRAQSIDLLKDSIGLSFAAKSMNGRHEYDESAFSK